MTINCRGELISLETPKIMGILNLTPDSFYDGGNYTEDAKILSQVEKMLTEGASFIDVGGQSTKPGARQLTAEEELKRVIPKIDLIAEHFPEANISIDSFYSHVAAESIAAGACMVNDISAGNLDKNMMQTVADYQVPYIMMHMKGNPQNMQDKTQYDGDMVEEIIYYFSEKIEKARAFGINDLIIDPGFGFAKTIDQNFELLKKLHLFENLDYPILVGLSRKSTIYKTLKTNADKALNGTTVLNTIALLNGASILRVHDVKEAVDCLKLVERYNA